MTIFSLDTGGVYLYYTCLDKMKNSSYLNLCRSIICRDEAEQIQALGSDGRRHEQVVTRALVRYVMSRCCRLPPEDVRFFINAHGKLALAKGVTSLPVRFNLSHCRGLVGCAVVLDADIGLDIETRDRIVSPNLARRFFSKTEIRRLSLAGTKDRQGMFLDLWTLKEAYAKAVGKGIPLGLNRFSFEFDQGRPRIQFESKNLVESGVWHFFPLILLERWQAAMAVLSKRKEQLHFHIHECIPSVTV